MQSGGFKHTGKVVKIDSSTDAKQGIVHVSMASIAACEGCKAKSQCRSMGKGEASESESRMVSVECRETTRYEVGDRVSVSMSYSIGAVAIVFAYIIPLFILVGGLVVLIGGFGLDEGLSAILTFVTLGLYYGCVYACRSFFESVVTFNLERVV